MYALDTWHRTNRGAIQYSALAKSEIYIVNLPPSIDHPFAIPNVSGVRGTLTNSSLRNARESRCVKSVQRELLDDCGVLLVYAVTVSPEGTTR